MAQFFKTMRSCLIIFSLIQTSLVNAVETVSSQISNSNGHATKTETYKFKKADETDLMTSVSMIAVGAVTSRLYKFKPVPDVMIAAAGGLAYVVGEVKSTMDFKELTHDEEVSVTYDSNGKPNDAQMEKLVKLKNNYDDAKKAAETKEKFQLGAAAAFFTAGAAAIVLKSSEMVALTACESALAGAAATCPEISPAIGTAKATLATYISERETPKPSMAGHEASTIGKATLIANIEAATSAASAVAAAECGTGIGCLKGSACASAAAQVQACNSVPLTLEQSESYGIMGSIGYDSNIQKLFDKKVVESKKFVKMNYPLISSLLNFFINSAEASYVNLLSGGGGLVAGYILTTFTAYGGYVDSQLLTPMKRAGTWAVLGALSLYSANKSRGISEEMKNNSDKVNSVVSELNRLEKGIKTSDATVTNLDLSKMNLGQQAIAISSDPKVSIPCLTSDSSSNCKSATDQIVSLPGFSNLPDSLKTIGKSTMSMGDSLSGRSSLTGTQLESVQRVGSMAIQAKNNLEKIKKQINDQFKISGKEQIDFDKNEKNLLASLNGVGAKELAAKGVSARDFMASINTSGLDLKKDSVGKDTKNENSKSNDKLSKASGSNKKEEKKPEEYKFNLGDVVGAEESKAEVAKNSKDEYEMGAAEIHKDDGVPIWKIISNRYIRSAYPKLLEEEKPIK